jgi:hypothetical protein
VIRKTKILKKKIQTCLEYEDKIPFIKGAYHGKTCYIISCGPSLKDIERDILREKLKDEFVVCIKQSYDLYGDICDLHVYNCANFKEYDYSVNPSSLIMESTSHRYFLNPNCDIKTFVVGPRGFDQTVSALGNFDEWTFGKTNIKRPYGPGIMYENVFFMMEFLGVKKVVTIGWDCNRNTASGVHFYDNRKVNVTLNDAEVNATMASLQAEDKVAANAIGKWNDWLASKEIELNVLSKLNPGPERMKRITLEEL